MHLLACLGIVLSFLEGVSSSCPSQCTCDDHSTNDGTGSRYAPLLAAKFPMILRKRTPTRQPSFEANCWSVIREEGLTSLSFNLIVLVLVAHFVVFILSSLALKSPSNYWRLSNTFCVTKRFFALVFIKCPFQEVKLTSVAAQSDYRKHKRLGPIRQCETSPGIYLLLRCSVSFWMLFMPSG